MALSDLASTQHPSSPALASIFGSGAHLPLEVAIPVIVVVVVARVIAARRRGQPGLVGHVVVRCRRGHLFTTRWSALGSLTSIRLGATRFQHCPVGDHWSLVRPVPDDELSAEDRLTHERNHR